MAYGNSFQRTTPVVLNLIIINVLVYLAQSAAGNSNRVFDLFALHHYKADVFQPYQVVTHMFMHGSFPHILFNMFALWMFGTTLERIWGPKRFLIFYLICGIGAAIAQLIFYAVHFNPLDHATLSVIERVQYEAILSQNATVGASGAIMGLLAAFGYLFPNTTLFIMPIPFPVKAKWAVIGYIALDLILGLSRIEGDNIARFAHVGGAVVGFFIVLYWNKTNKQTFY